MHPYDPDYDSCYPECPECNNYHAKIGNAGDFFSAVLEELYSQDPINVGNLENALDELSSLFGMKLPNADLKVSRKKEETPIYLKDWMNFNNNYLKAIAE